MSFAVLNSVEELTFIYKTKMSTLEMETEGSRSFRWRKAEELFHDKVFKLEDWNWHRTWTRHLPKPRFFLLVALELSPVIVMVEVATVTAGLYYELLQVRSYL